MFLKNIYRPFLFQTSHYINKTSIYLYYAKQYEGDDND